MTSMLLYISIYEPIMQTLPAFYPFLPWTRCFCAVCGCERQGTSGNIWHKCQLDIGVTRYRTLVCLREKPAGFADSWSTAKTPRGYSTASPRLLRFPWCWQGCGEEGRTPLTHPAPPRAHTQLRCSAILGVHRAKSRSQEQKLSPPACCRLLYLAVGTWESQLRMGEGCWSAETCLNLLSSNGSSDCVPPLEGPVWKLIAFSYFCDKKKSNLADMYLRHNSSDELQLLHSKINLLLSVYLPSCSSRRQTNQQECIAFKCNYGSHYNTNNSSIVVVVVFLTFTKCYLKMREGLTLCFKSPHTKVNMYCWELLAFHLQSTQVSSCL